MKSFRTLSLHFYILGAPPPPPRTFSSLKIHFSAPNHRTDMKLFVYEPNTSKNECKFFSNFFSMKNWPKKYKSIVSVV